MDLGFQRLYWSSSSVYQILGEVASGKLLYMFHPWIDCILCGCGGQSKSQWMADFFFYFSTKENMLKNEMSTIENSKFSLNKVEWATSKRDFKGILVSEKSYTSKIFFQLWYFLFQGRRTSIAMCYKLAV